MAIDTNAASIRIPQMPSVNQTLADAMKLRADADTLEAQQKERARVEQQRAKQEQEDMRVRLSFEGLRRADGSPDAEKIVNDVSKYAPERAMKLQQDFGTLRTQQSQQKLADFNMQNQRLDRAVQVLGSVDPTSPNAALDYEVAHAYINSRDPEMGAWLGPWDPKTSPGKIKTAIASATSLSEQNRVKSEAMQNVVEGKLDEALARWGGLVTSQKGLDDFLGFARSIHVPEEQLRLLPTEYDGVKTPEAMAKLGITPQQKAENDARLKTLKIQADREERLAAAEKKAAAAGGGGGAGAAAIGAVGVRAANEAMSAKVDAIDEQEAAGEIKPEEAQKQRDAAYQRYRERVGGQRPGPLTGTAPPKSDGSGTGHNPAATGTPAPGAAAPAAAATPEGTITAARGAREAALKTPPAKVPVTRGGRTYYVAPGEAAAPGTPPVADAATGNVHQQAPRRPVPEDIKKKLAKAGPGIYTDRPTGKRYMKSANGALTPIN